jgi:hypothetical protein
MRPDLTSAEIAMSGSYFDDVLRDPRRYGSENTTDKVRRRGAVRRRRDAVCTERIVGDSEKGPPESPVPCSSRHLTGNALAVEAEVRRDLGFDGITIVTPVSVLWALRSGRDWPDTVAAGQLKGTW